MGSSRAGKGVSWQVGSGEAGSGDPRGVRRGEQVKPKVWADLSAAVKVQNKHRCSDSWPQRLDRVKRSIYTCFSTYQFTLRRLESNEVIYVRLAKLCAIKGVRVKMLLVQTYSRFKLILTYVHFLPRFCPTNRF